MNDLFCPDCGQRVHRIFRVALQRALSSHILKGTRPQIAVELVNEFRDGRADVSLLRQCSFSIQFYAVSTRHLIDGQAKAVKISKDRFIYDVSFPTDIGCYQLHITGVCRDGAVALIPMISEAFEITDILVASSSFLLGTFSRYDLGCVSNPAEGVLMYEEFGATLGSHAWDSAVVFARHVSGCLNACSLSKRGLAVELGAGCGLAGISLARQGFDNVVITDKSCNVSYMRKNIELNASGDIVRADTLDWTSEDDISRLKMSTGSTDIDLILAADVLYDNDAAICLFDLLRALATPRTTCILLGQKLRPLGEHRKRFDVSALNDFEAEQILMEADVILWRITLK